MRRFLLLALCGLGVLGCDEGPLTVELAASGFDLPVFVTAPPGDPSRLVVLEQNSGRVWLIKDGEVLAEPFLDLGSKVRADSFERGLFSLAFHPDYSTNGRLFVAYTGASAATVVEEYGRSANPDLADGDTGRIILAQEQPFANHNGGMIAFSPVDGFLYIGLGDGGSRDDPSGNGQNLSTRFGKILRIDVDGGDPFAIPPSNPFAGVEGADETIWAYGLRNPWRFSFDRLTGDLYIGDVGQEAREEIDFQPFDSPGGENYGWNIAEGFACRGGGGACGSDPAFTPPIHDYSQFLTRSVTGGHVYRGSAIPGLQGVYFFADFISGSVWSFRFTNGVLTEFTDRTAELNPTRSLISSFGEDASGECYIVDHRAGAIYRIIANPMDG